MSQVIDLSYPPMLRLNEIRARVAFSNSHLYALLKRRQFPQLGSLGPKSRGLPEHVLDAWLMSCASLRSMTIRLQDPVSLPEWPPAVIQESPVRGIRMLRLCEVERRVGLRHSQIYRNIDAGTFPRPVPLGERVRRWLEHEIEEWLRQRFITHAELVAAHHEWYLRPIPQTPADRSDPASSLP